METRSHVTGPVRAWLRIEGLVTFGIALVLYAKTGAGWGRFAALFLVPDLSMLGYLAGARAGADVYNAAHALVGPAVIGVLALVGVAPEILAPLSCIWLAHVGFDRTLGYGLKYGTAFGHTHLGVIGHALSPALAH